MAFASVMPWFPYLLAFIVLLFAFSTTITWGYYGAKAASFLARESKGVLYGFKGFYLVMVVIGCTMQLSAIVAEANSADPWTSRARPSFLYMMYALILWAIPMGLISAASPEMGEGIARGMSAYLRGIPEELYALFGTGYLGYTAARAWGKAKGIER